MQEFASTRSTTSAGSLFSPREIEKLMRVEFERAQRHKIPIVCKLISIDRLAQLQDLYGQESKTEILRAIHGVLRTSSRDSDLFGWLADDKLLAVFPHTPPDVAAVLARRVIAGARKLRFDRDGRTLGVGLSIGVAHNQHPGTLSFETLIRVAEEGLAVAHAAGGDRFVETELYQLYEQRRRQDAMRRTREEAFLEATPFPEARRTVHGPGAAAPGSAPAPAVDPRTKEERLRELLSSTGYGTEEYKNLDLDTVVRAIQRLRESSGAKDEGDLDEARRRIETLERRIAKLVHALGVTEEELQRIATMKGLDLGIASVYRSVQGLSDEATHRELKLLLMREIFQANFDAQRREDPGDGPAASGRSSA
jgi:diguanylate cyclase (GGDEF)-like protein